MRITDLPNKTSITDDIVMLERSDELKTSDGSLLEVSGALPDLTTLPKEELVTSTPVLINDPLDTNASIRSIQLNTLASGIAADERLKKTEPTISEVDFYNKYGRGKNLGSTLTAEQSATIQSGEFNDIYLLDYWSKDGIDWVVVGKNVPEFVPQYNNGFYGYRLVLTTRRNIDTCAMNKATTESGIENTGFAQALIDNSPKAYAVFGDALCKGSDLYSGYRVPYPTKNSTTNVLERDTCGIGDIDPIYDVEGTTYLWPLMQTLLYGYDKYSGIIPFSQETLIEYNDDLQLKGFDLDPTLIASDNPYWLCDVADSLTFVCVNIWGDPEISLYNENGVRPLAILHKYDIHKLTP